MTVVWLTIGGLTLATVVLRAAGPLVLGGRELPKQAHGVIALLAPALLTALIVTDTFARDQDLTIDARAAGLTCAGVAAALRAPLIVTVVAAAIGAAVVRKFT